MSKNLTYLTVNDARAIITQERQRYVDAGISAPNLNADFFQKEAERWVYRSWRAHPKTLSILVDYDPIPRTVIVLTEHSQGEQGRSCHTCTSPAETCTKCRTLVLGANECGACLRDGGKHIVLDARPTQCAQRAQNTPAPEPEPKNPHSFACPSGLLAIMVADAAPLGGLAYLAQETAAYRVYVLNTGRPGFTPGGVCISLATDTLPPPANVAHTYHLTVRQGKRLVLVDAAKLPVCKDMNECGAYSAAGAAADNDKGYGIFAHTGLKVAGVSIHTGSNQNLSLLYQNSKDDGGMLLHGEIMFPLDQPDK